MSAGRCAGCGFTNSSCKLVRSHVMNCEEYLALWRDSPDKALSPEDEFARYSESGDAASDKQTKKDDALDARFRKLQEVRDQQVARMVKPPDPLDDL